MVNIKEKKISIETAADLIKKTRIEKKIELDRVADALKINIRYLEALEKGNYGSLPRGLYGKSFLKEYALYLKLNPQEILRMYEEETRERKKMTQEDLFSKRVPKNLSFIAIPRITKNLIIIASVATIFLYLGFYIRNLLNPPTLIIINPEKDMVIKEHDIEIKGRTELETELTINNESILTDKDGNFEKNVSLSNGLNIINISSKKKYSKENKIIRKIIVE